MSGPAWGSNGSDEKRVIRTYPDLTRFPDGRFSANWNLRSFRALLKRPRRLLRPMPHRIRCPSGGLILVARGTGVRHLVLVCHCRRNELECVRAYKRAGDAFGLDLRHMAGHALTPWATVLVVSVLLHGRYVRAIRRRRTVAIKADLVGRLAKLSIVLSAVYIMARSACDSFSVHHALHEIVPLHPVLMRRSVREMSEGCLA